MEKQTIVIRKQNRGNVASRNNFRCLLVTISPDDSLLSTGKAQLNKISGKLNPHSANGAVIRSDTDAYTDNYIGLIAEYACYDILKDVFGETKVIKPSSQSSNNQVDIKLANNKRIEVRSSCVRNGISFAIYNLDKNGQQYIDVIGPYFNESYKQFEEIKDYYMRVIFEGETSSIYSKIINGEDVQLYITGGVTKHMLSKNGKNKYMVATGDSRIKNKGTYKVIPLSESLDYPEFIDVISVGLGDIE